MVSIGASRAEAATACSTVNGGGFNFSVAAAGSDTRTVAGFVVGDKIAFSVTRPPRTAGPDGVAFDLQTLASTVYSSPDLKAPSETFTYTVTGGSDTTLTAILDSLDLPATLTAICTPGASAAALSLSATASPTVFFAVGQTVAMTYAVRNSGAAPVSNLAVTDNRVANITCAATTLAAGASTTCTGTTVTTPADVSARGFATQATARGSSSGTPVATTPVVTTIALDTADVVRRTREGIASLLNQRANFLTSNGPDTYRQYARLGAGEASSGSGAAQPFGLQGLGGPATGDRSSGSGLESFGGRAIGSPMTMSDDTIGRPPNSSLNQATASEGTSRPANLAMSLSQLRQAAAVEERAKRDSVEGKGPMRLSPGNSAANRDTTSRSPLDVWVEAVGGSYTLDRADGKRRGTATVAYAGVDYLAQPGLLVGLLVQGDWMRDSTDAGLARSGSGWMVGPYVSARLSPHLFFDARAAWGRSTNQIDPSGAYTDTFQTNRILTSARLTGDWTSGAWRFRPGAELVYFSESQKAYVNAIGLDVAATTATLGRAIVGPEVSYRFALPNAVTLEPFAGIKGIWDFARTQETVSGQPAGTANLRARLEGGLTVRLPSGASFRATGAYDGVGAPGYHAVQGKVWIAVPLP